MFKILILFLIILTVYAAGVIPTQALAQEEKIVFEKDLGKSELLRVTRKSMVEHDKTPVTKPAVEIKPEMKLPDGFAIESGPHDQQLDVYSYILIKRGGNSRSRTKNDPGADENIVNAHDDEMAKDTPEKESFRERIIWTKTVGFSIRRGQEIEDDRDTSILEVCKKENQLWLLSVQQSIMQIEVLELADPGEAKLLWTAPLFRTPFLENWPRLICGDRGMYVFFESMGGYIEMWDVSTPDVKTLFQKGTKKPLHPTTRPWEEER